VVKRKRGETTKGRRVLRMETFLQAVNPACTAFSNAIDKYLFGPFLCVVLWAIVPVAFVVFAVYVTKMITRRP